MRSFGASYLCRLLLACTLSSAGPASLAEVLEVIVAPVREAVLSDPIHALGTLRANESAQLTATITETISDIRFNDGQRVRAGDVLVAMTNREQLAELAEAEAELAEARQQHQRIEQLAAKDQESRALLDQQRRELDTARARLQAVQARLRDRLITAPFDGVVGLRTLSVGSLLEPGTVITTLHDDSIMKLDFPVPEVFLARISPGLPLSARSRAWPDQVFEGQVVSVSNEVDPVTRAFQVRAELPNPERRLRPGMLMMLTLGSRERSGLVVPEEALITRGREHHVFVIEGAGGELRARRREVQIGSRRPGEVEILNGLRADTRVVVHGGFRLSDGDPVKIRAEVDEEMDKARSLSEILSNGEEKP